MIRRAALALGLLAVASPAGAAEVDRQVNLNAQSCQDFLNASPADVATILAWLDGYYQDEDAPPVIDFDSLKTNAAKLKAFCGVHKDETVGAAAESLFGRQ
jgi:acid stress chaperone HdeB